MKYNLFDGHRPNPQPHYCPVFEGEMRAALALVAKLAASIIAFLVGVAAIIANRHSLDAISPLAQAYICFTACLAGGVWWLVRFLKSK